MPAFTGFLMEDLTCDDVVEKQKDQWSCVGQMRTGDEFTLQ